MILKTKLASALILMALPFFLPLERIDSWVPAAAFLWPFVWPVPFLVYEWFGKHDLLKQVIRVAALMLSLLSGYYIFAVAFSYSVFGLTDIMIQVYVAIFALVLYFVASLIEMFHTMSSNYQKIQI